MNAPTPIPLRVRLIVPMLGSSVDGEALGACRAIGRTLDTAGLDFHALAAAIRVEGEEHPETGRRRPKPGAGQRRTAPEPERSGPRSYGDWRETYVRYHHRRHFTPRQEIEQRGQIAFCLRNLARLRSRERDFILSISRAADGLSLAQATWLADLTDRLDHEARRA